MTDLENRSWLTYAQAAEYLGINKATIYRWAKRGVLRAYGFGGVKRVRRQELDALLGFVEEQPPHEAPVQEPEQEPEDGGLAAAIAQLDAGE